MSIQFYPLAVAGVLQETHDARSYIFEVPAPLRETFRYRAGQFLTFEIPWQGMRIRRCYSLCSAPEVDAWHKVTVKQVADGRVSNWFHENLKVGDMIDVQAPEGKFLLNSAHAERPMVLLGGGSGITPLMSLIKSALVTSQRRLQLIYANRDPQSIIFHSELELLAQRHPERLQIHHHLDDVRGFMTQNDITPLIKDWVESDFYICGPTAFMDIAESTLQALGDARTRAHFERFVSPIDADRRPAETELAAAQPTEVPATFRIKSGGKYLDIPYTPGLTLLQSAQQSGIFKAPSSCEDGYCGCCMALLKSGQVQMKTHEALTKADLERGWILCCQARPTSAEPIEIDYDAQY